MTPHMSEAKIQLLSSSLTRATHYLEYGIGGSTVLAAQQSLSTLIGIDSSEEWVQKVRMDIEKSNFSGNITLLHANLGPTAEWGYPIDKDRIENWPSYYSSPWSIYRQSAYSPDLILIDGRFRACCFLFSLLQCQPGTRILWNNYINGLEHNFIEKILPPQGIVDDMAIFSAPASINTSLNITLLFENLFNLD